MRLVFAVTRYSSAFLWVSFAPARRKGTASWSQSRGVDITFKIGMHDIVEVRSLKAALHGALEVMRVCDSLQ